MGLQRLADSETLNHIRARIREIQEYNKAHPEEAVRRDAAIDADAERMKQFMSTPTARSQPTQESFGRYSRTAMRRVPPEW